MNRCRRCDEFHSKHPFENGLHQGTHYASPITCAFVDGTFSLPNWNCLTMDVLRQDVLEREVWNEDQHLAIGKIEFDFYVLSYYKHRGETEGAWVCDGKTMRVMTLEDAEKVILSKMAVANEVDA